MGLDVNVSVVVGIKVKYDYVEKIITKFCENTGKPYSKRIKELQYIDKIDDENLEMFSCDCCDDEKPHTAIQGILISGGESHRQVDDLEDLITELDLTQLKKLVEGFASKYLGRDPKIYVVPNFGY